MASIFLYAFMLNGKTTTNVGSVRCHEEELRKLKAHVSLAETGREYLI